MSEPIQVAQAQGAPAPTPAPTVQAPVVPTSPAPTSAPSQTMLVQSEPIKIEWPASHWYDSPLLVSLLGTLLGTALGLASSSVVLWLQWKREDRRRWDLERARIYSEFMDATMNAHYLYMADGELVADYLTRREPVRSAVSRAYNSIYVVGSRAARDSAKKIWHMYCEGFDNYGRRFGDAAFRRDFESLRDEFAEVARGAVGQ